jgi:hypothetical protein
MMMEYAFIPGTSSRPGGCAGNQRHHCPYLQARLEQAFGTKASEVHVLRFPASQFRTRTFSLAWVENQEIERPEWTVAYTRDICVTSQKSPGCRRRLLCRKSVLRTFARHGQTNSSKHNRPISQPGQPLISFLDGTILSRLDSKLSVSQVENMPQNDPEKVGISVHHACVNCAVDVHHKGEPLLLTALQSLISQ